METRIAVVSMTVKNFESVQELNGIFHEYGKYIMGRIGLPYTEKNINIISVVLDAPQDIVNTLSGKIGKLDGVNSKVTYF